MIGSLRGVIQHKEASSIIVETGGVGYLVQIPFSTFFTLGEVGSEAFLLIHTNVREDALQLFGFASAIEQRVFERLIGITGIGPKMALTILSGIPSLELTQAVRGGDIRRLTAVPGLGKKTAERLVLELRDKLDFVDQDADTAPSPLTSRTVREDATSALINLGYRQKDAEAAVAHAEADLDIEADVEQLLKAALSKLAR